MSVSLSIDGPGDAELISAVRGGDAEAYGELFARHVDAARRLARQLAGPADADDLVSDAFTKVFTVLQRGGGPDLAFRAYLLTAVRRLHVDKIRAGSRLRPVDDLTPFDPGLPFQDTAIEGFDNAAAARAFASLPERWQMVLWHTEVEQQKPADIAPLLGMSANSVSALAYRAREGLRQAFLSQHAIDPDDVDCAWTRDHLGAYVRGGLSRRDAARVDDHLAACRACAAVYLELTEVNSGLAALLAPLLLGTAGAGYLSSTGGAGAAGALSTSLGAARTWIASHASMTAVGGMVVAATAVLSIYGATHLNGHEAADLGSPQVNRAPAAALPTTGTHGHANHHHNRGSNPKSSDGRGTPPATHSQAPNTTPPVSNDSTPTTVNPSGPASQPTTGPSTPTTGPTTGPNGPTGPTDGPTNGPTGPTTGPSGPGQQSITFTSTPPSNPKFGSTYHVHAKGGSGQITFSVDSTTTNSACAMQGAAVVRFDHAGTCVIAADATSKAAGHDATQWVVGPHVSQTVSISSQPTNPVVGGAAYTVTADAGVAGTQVSYTASGGCSVSGDTVSFQHAGDCTVTAHQDGNHDYTAATDSQSFPVGQGPQTIDFSMTSKGAVGTTVPLAATSSSGLAVGFSVDPATTNAACSLVDAATLSFDHAGTCVVDADQPGNGDYLEAAQVVQSVDVSAPVHGLMTVSASAAPLHGKGQMRVTAVVDGLPQGSSATLTVSVPSSSHAVADPKSGCTESSAGKGQTFVCPVTQADHQEFVFDVTVNQGRPDMTFDLTPDPPLTLDPGSVTHFVLPLGDNKTAAVATRSFGRRTQS